MDVDAHTWLNGVDFSRSFLGDSQLGITSLSFLSGAAMRGKGASAARFENMLFNLVLPYIVWT